MTVPNRKPSWIPVVLPGLRAKDRVAPSLAQVALGYKDIFERITANQASEGLPVAHNGTRAAVITAEAFGVPMRTVLDAVEARAEASIIELKAFQAPPPRELGSSHLEDFGLELDPAFLARADRAKALVHRARFGPATALRMLTDMLAFNMPLNKELIMEGIEHAEELVNVLSKLVPLALCPACKGHGCDVCDFGLVSVGQVASMPAESLIVRGE